MTKKNGTLLTALIIDVGILLFPDGTNHYFKILPVFKDQPNKNHKYIQECMGKWFEANKVRYELRGINPGQLASAYAQIRMLETDFEKIPATSEFHNMMNPKNEGGK